MIDYLCRSDQVGHDEGVYGHQNQSHPPTGMKSSDHSAFIGHSPHPKRNGEAGNERNRGLNDRLQLVARPVPNSIDSAVHFLGQLPDVVLLEPRLVLVHDSPQEFLLDPMRLPFAQREETRRLQGDGSERGV